MILGVDIGGSHITVAQITPKGEVKNICRETVNSQGNINSILTEWASGFDGYFREANKNLVQIGIAMPGPFTSEGVSKIKGQHKYDALYNLNIRQLLADKLGVPINAIKLNNDALCFLLGEMTKGKAHNYRRALGLTLGTGLGSAVYNGSELIDANLWCTSFKTGIAEDYLSTRWFIGRYHHYTGKLVSGVRELVSLLPNEPIVGTIFNEFGQNLADFITHIIENYQPDVIVMGGNITKQHHLFNDVVIEILKGRSIDIPIEYTQLGEKAALIGAASYWLPKYQNELS